MHPLTTRLKKLQERLDSVASCERHALSKEVQKLLSLSAKQSDNQALFQTLRLLEERIQSSIAIIADKQARLPDIIFSDGLPISNKREDIAKAIENNQVVVIAGETGSGKTTQLPKICLSLGRGLRGLIGHTQPRRIAARSVANRIAEELDSPLGELVGYQVRFTDQVSENTAIKLMTDGILLAEIQHDRYLSRYDTIIIDEAHERSLNIDFLLGYLKQLLPKRPDLKVIITSATIDVEKFSRHFDNAPIIEVSGRTFPVDVWYRPLLENEHDSIIEGIVAAVHEITTVDHQGDILVFLSGERDIRETALRLRRESLPHLSIVPLYARLSMSEQNKVFQPQPGRRIVLATNVAETSLTVPGIRYVIDPGYARISRYSFRTKIQRLPVEAISQASANQRKGRCGRVSEGICIRLYSEDDFLSRPEFTDPEILRTNLAAVILQMAQLRLGDVRHFPFVDMPDHRLISDGHKLLQELQATNARQQLTHIGRQLASLPVDPRFGRMLLAANSEACLQEMLIIISALSIQDPRERPADKQQAADQRHREYWHEDSDFCAYVSLWQGCEEQRQALSNNGFKKWSQKQFLSHNRLREWRDLHKQLMLAIKKLGFTVNSQPADYSSIHKSLISGLLGNIGQWSKIEENVGGSSNNSSSHSSGNYLGARNRRFSIFPGSSQFKKSPRWLVAAELIETSKLYAHTVAKIETDWVLSLAQHLVKRSYSEPHYHASSGQVMAYEKITLYGLPLVEKKRVSYSKIEPDLCRELFIRGALVEGLYSVNKRIKQQLSHHNAENHFYYHQQQLLKELHELEAKSRRRDIVVDDDTIFNFYNELIPGNIVNLEGFESWRKQIERQQPKLLFINRTSLMQRSDAHISAAQFPDSLAFNGIRIPVSYHFDPVHQDDGVTISVPVSVLHMLSSERLEWLVPGLLAEKVTAMIKALPKQWRKQFAPVPSTVDHILPLLIADEKNQQQTLASQLSEQLYRYKGVQVPDELWEKIALDTYYLMNIHVTDPQGKLIDRGRNLSQLRARYRDQVQDHLQLVGNDFEQDGLTQWNFGLLPETHVLKQSGLNITVYPGLNDNKNSISLKLYDNPQQAWVETLKGQVRLAMLSQAQVVKYLRKHLLKNRELGLSLVDMGSRENVIDDIICATVRQCCFEAVQSPVDLVRDSKQFEQVVEGGRGQWVERAELIAQLLVDALEQVNHIKKQAKKCKNPLLLTYAMADIQQQLKGLFYPGCLYATPLKWLQQYARYLKAILIRLEKAPMNVNQDRAQIVELEILWQRYQDKLLADREGVSLFDFELQLYRWMLEELRVSLFAQSLGTILPVSVKRLNKQWEKCQ